MKDWILLGMKRYMIPIPPIVWRRQVVQSAQASTATLAFMTEDHHRVREYVVMELPRRGQPISPDSIGRDLGLPSERVRAILDELEQNMVFAFRRGGQSVVWAYPVTVDATPHRVTYSTGEQGYAA